MNDPVEEDLEGRDKPKVSYVCGGKSHAFESPPHDLDRLRQDKQTGQGLSDQMHALWSQDLLQDER